MLSVVLLLLKDDDEKKDENFDNVEVLLLSMVVGLFISSSISSFPISSSVIITGFFTFRNAITDGMHVTGALEQ